MDIYSHVIAKIIKEQQSIIGPLAVDQARKVAGLQIATNGDVSIAGTAKDVLGNLVNQYAQLFGQASIEVCKDVIKETKPSVPVDELPEILR